MALGTASALLLAGGGFTAASQFAGANIQAKSIEKQAEYNAKIYDQQGEIIKEKKRIQEYQYNREAARVRGAIIARTASKGLMLSGSPLAILIDNETNMLFDKAIADYNLNIETNYARSGATYMRETGANQSRLSRFSGFSNAFSTALSTGASIGIMNMPNQRKPGKR